MKTAWAVAAVAVLVAWNLSAGKAETWIGPTADGSQGGSWATNTNWNPNTVPNAIGASATFNSDQTATRAVTLDAATKVGSINITNNTGFQNAIRDGAGGTLEFDATDAGPATVVVNGTDPNPSGSAIQNRIEATMVFTDSLQVTVNNTNLNSTGSFSLLGIVTGPGGLIKDGPGTMTVAFTPSTTDRFKDYTGPTIINQGRARFSQSVNSPPRMTSSVTVNPGGQIIFANAGTAVFGSQLASPSPVNLNGNGLSAFPGAIRADQGASKLDNPVVLQSNTSIAVVSISVAANNLASYELLREVSGPGILTMGYRPGLFDRRGTLILSAANTYSNGTIIEQGAIRVDGAGTLGTGTVMVDGAQVAGDAAFDTYGALVLNTNTAIADTGYLNLTGGGVVNTPDRGYADLASGTDEVVGGLMLGGVIFGAGTYGSSASGAPLANQYDEYFAGTGTVTVVPAGVPGDYNNNGLVDAADYVVWRKGGTLANDFTPGVQASDHDFWRSRFGANTNPGSGSGLGLDASAVPEPSAIVLSLLSVPCGLSLRRARRRVIL